MQLEQATVVAHAPIQGSYNLLQMNAPGVAARVCPGQFIHIKVPYLEECILRRPFSVFRVEGALLSILYKDVGKGTRTLQYLEPGESLSILGPLGHGFPQLQAGNFPVLIAGGYGMAALYLLARRCATKGVAFFGGRSAQDILCVSDFEALGWDVRVTTEDGTQGRQGLVTLALDDWFAHEAKGHKPELFVCGPGGMLKAAAERAERHQCTAWTSVDNNMGCGVGACLTCVLKVKDGESWTWARACREGPVFNSRDILWEELV